MAKRRVFSPWAVIVVCLVLCAMALYWSDRIECAGSTQHSSRRD